MPVPVINIAQMREWEKATWASGQTESAVIRRVGQLVAREALRLTKPQDSILILAGKGHNGEDARSAREHLTDRRVDLLDIKDPTADLTTLDASLSLKPALIVDGLFGIGINRALSPEWVQFIQRINQAQGNVLAVDIPSGMNADTGEAQGAAVQASVTLTVGAPKQGMLQPAAWPFVGRLEVASEVGLVPCPLTSDINWTLPEDFTNYPPRRSAATHKGSYGHVAIFAGSLGYHGAAVLAARGAQRAQPGLITLNALETVYHAIASQLQAVMVSVWQPQTTFPGGHSSILIGPGLAATDVPPQMQMLTRHLWRDSPVPMVVDASALDWLVLDPVSRPGIRVLTPHPGEAARLLRSTVQQVQANRVKALREISHRFGEAWVVLKGHQTLIGRASGPIDVNSSGNPHLAQGGSGDVLAGYLAGLLAQPGLQADVRKTICHAVWQHGAAADRLQEHRRNWVVEELIEELGR